MEWIYRLCCCIFKPMPEGFSLEENFQGLSGCVLCCRCLICHFLAWLVWGMFIFLLIFHPHEPRFTVTDASLTQFNFNSSDNNTGTNLHYHLALNITIRNPNKRVGIDYRNMTASVSYRKKKFGLVNLMDSVSYYQGHKNTTFLHLVLQGQQQLVKFGKGDISQFDKETAAGVYSITVQVTFRVKIRYGNNKAAKFWKPVTQSHQQINCKLKLPVSVTDETSGGGFKATKCGDVDIFSTLPKS